MAITDQVTRVFLGSNDPLTDTDAAWVTTNAGGVLFSRNFTESERSLYDSGTTIMGLYSNFTTMTDGEYATWVANEAFPGQIDGFLMTDSLGAVYDHINGGTEKLCDFSNTDWLDFRLSKMPDWNGSSIPAGTNLDQISMDLCPLYPVSNLIGTQGNPFADEDTWKANMIAAVTYVRTKVHSSIAILCNGLREFLNETGFKNNPGAFDTYDGTDLVETGVADAVNIEAGLDYTNIGQGNAGLEWLYTLRAMYRCSNDDKIAVGAFVADTSSSPMSEDEIQRRVNNFVSYALIYKPDYTLFAARSENTFSPYPIESFPENGIDLGTPVEAVNSLFTSHTSPVQQLITRTFMGGDAAYVALYNYSFSTVAVPEAYTSGYEQVRPTGYVQVDSEGVTLGALETAPVGATLAAGEGMLLQPQAGTLTVTTDSLEQLSGECTAYFGVGQTGMMLDTGEFHAGSARAELRPFLDLQDGEGWEIAVDGKDQPGDRSDRSALTYTATAAGAQDVGTGGTGRWLRAVIRSRRPSLHRLGSAEADIQDGN